MRTISFYSYKGGTGRTLLVANLAVYAARLGLNVVMADLDLEAPGLAYKFLPAPPKRPGVLDWLRTSPRPAISTMAMRLEVPDPFNPDGVLRLIGAGPPPSLTYLRELRNFQSTAFGDSSSDAVAGMLALRDAIEEQFAPDLLLLDARTGISNTNAITTRVLADDVVAVALNTREQLEGTREVLRSLTTLAKPRDPDARLGLHVVISRIHDPERGVDDAHVGGRDTAIADSVRRYLTEPADPLVHTLDLTADPLLLHNDVALAANEHLLLAADRRPGRSHALHFDYLRIAERLFGDEVLDPAIAEAFGDIDDVQRAQRAEFFGDASQALVAKAPQPLLESVSIGGLNRVSLRNKVDLLRRAAKKDASRRPDLAEALIELAWASFETRTSSTSTGLSFLREAERIYQKLASKSESYLPALVDTLIQYSAMAMQLGKQDVALDAATEAVYARPAIDFERAIPPELAAKAVANLAAIRYTTGDPTMAVAAIERAITILDELKPGNSAHSAGTTGFNLQYASAHNLNAVIHGSLGNYDVATQSAESAVSLYRAALVADPGNPAAEAGLASGLSNMANLHRISGDFTAAIAAAAEAMQLLGELASAQPQTYLPELASAAQTLSACYADAGDYRRAVQLAEHSVHLWRDLTAVRTEHEYAIGMITALSNLAARLAETGELPEAQAAATEAVRLGAEIRRQISTDSVDAEAGPALIPPLRAVDEATAPAWVNLARVNRDSGLKDLALEAAQQARRTYESLGSVKDHHHIRIVIMASELLLEQGDLQSAEEAARTAVELSDEIFAPLLAAAAHTNAARVGIASGSREALSHAQRALKIVRRLGDKTGEALALETMGDVYAAAGLSTDAAEVREQTARIRRSIVSNAEDSTSN